MVKTKCTLNISVLSRIASDSPDRNFSISLTMFAVSSKYVVGYLKTLLWNITVAASKYTSLNY